MKKIIAGLLCLCMAFSFAACGGSGDTVCEAVTDVPSQELVSEQPSEEVPEEPELDTGTPLSIMVLNGTTGFGMAKLISDVEGGTAAVNYKISVETDASNITAALINGSVDIAALPTNAASAVYNKTDGEVQVLALITRGVLYVVTDGENEVTSFEDLRGKTVYCPAQNPTFIFSYLCEMNGLKPGEDIIIDNTFAQPADLRTAMVAGEVGIAVLAEPLITAAVAANDALSVDLDLTEEWDAASPEGSLVQSCVVVRRAFAEENPALVARFLADCEASIAFLDSDTEEASQMIVDAGIFTSAPIAMKAIPKCNLCFIAGRDMQAALGDFLDIMYEIAPASIGGAVPGEDFYYIP